MTMQAPCSSRLMDQDFGNCITPDDLIFPFNNIPGHNYYRPWRWALQNMTKDFGSTISDDSDKFKLALDVQQFQPNEISVKVINNEVIVEAKHEEREDGHGFVSRQFMRRYALPKDCKMEEVTSTLSSDGILTVIANKMSTDKTKNNERVVPIKFCSTAVRSNKINEAITETKSTNTEAKSCSQDKTKSTNTEAQSCSRDMKKDTQIMLKEDHSRLLKPEFIKAETSDAAATDSKYKIAKDTKSKIDEIFSMSEKCAQSSASIEKGAISAAAFDKNILSNEQIKIEGSCCSANTEIIGESCTTSASSKMFGETSMAAVTEITSSKTSEVITSEESSSFSSSSMSSCMKATTENLAEIITAELKEAAENM